MSETIKNKGWSVTFAGTGINLALGILYTWSIFQASIVESIETGIGGFDWDRAAVGDPYAVCCLVFAFSMILAGKCQDLYGPRITAFIGGILVGLGLLLISQSTSYVVWVLGFGVLAGAGIGFGYSSATPPALKWFPGGRTGLIAGLVVAGFGLAPVYIAPLASFLVDLWSLQEAMMFFAIAFFIVVSVLSQFLVNPPVGFHPEGLTADKEKAKESTHHAPEVSPREVIRTATFWKLWFLYFIGAGAGLMVIGSIAGMAKQSMGDAAFIAVAIMAVGNASGRIIAGVVADALGRKVALMIFLSLQALNMFLAIYVVGAGDDTALLIVLSATFIGFNYGTNLTLFPSYAKALWGLKSFGVNYGMLFTAWGVGGLVMARLSAMLYAQTESFNYSLAVAGILLIVATIFTLRLKIPQPGEPAA